MASEENNDLDYSALASTDQDTTQESLTEEAKFLLETHEPRRAHYCQKDTPKDSHSGTSTPSTIKRTGSTISDSTPIATASSEGTLVLPPRRTYINIAETKEENKRLKAEVFNLKTQLYLLKQDLPKMVNSEGKDFTDEYLAMRAELKNEKVRRTEMEQMWLSQKKVLEEERAKFGNEKRDWETKQKNLLSEKDKLQVELNELRPKVSEHDDGSESQGESSVSNISLMSERGMEMERLRSIIVQQSVDEKKLRNKMENEIAQMNEQLKRAAEELSLQTERYNEEKIRCESLKNEMAKLQQLADSAAQELEYQKQVAEEQVAKAYADSEIALNKRDQTIRILVKKLKANGAETPTNSKLEENSSMQHNDVSNLNPYAQEILKKIDEFGVQNEAIRKRVVELGVHDVDLSLEIEPSEAISTEDEESGWNTKRCERENEKLAAVLAQNKNVHYATSEDDLGGKLALFDAVNGVAPAEELSRDQLEYTARSMGASEMLNVTSAADLLSKSLVLTEDLGEVRKKLSVLQSVCTRLFEKLRGTAEFLQTLLDELGAGDRGKELLEQIEALRIDLDQSRAAAIDISRDVEAAEEGIEEFSAQLQRSMDYSFSLSSVPSNENQQNASALSRAHAAYRKLNTELANEKMKTNEITELNEELQVRIATLEESKQKICDELDELTKNMEMKENEMALHLQDVEEQLEYKGQQYDELFERAEKLREELETKEAEAGEKVAEVRHVLGQMTGKYNELEQHLAEANRALLMKDETIRKLHAENEHHVGEVFNYSNEVLQYRGGINRLDQKMCELVSSLKESLGITDKQAVKPILSMTSSIDSAALHQLAQIGADLEEFAKISGYINDLKSQLVSVQQNLDLCERKRDATVTKCHALVNQNALLETECDSLKQKIQDAKERMEADRTLFKSLTEDLQRLRNEKDNAMENNERLTKALIDVEAKYEELATKPNRSSLSDMGNSHHYMMAATTMTSLSAQDLAELTDKMKTITSFAKRMYALAERWGDGGTKIPEISYKSVDLEHLYRLYARILKRLTDGLNELREQIAENNAQLLSKESEEKSSRHPSGNSKTSDDENLGTSSFQSGNESGNELASVDVQVVLDAANQIVQDLKAISNEPQKAKMAEMLIKMRSLRSQIASIHKKSQQLEKMKENIAPMESLQGENERLQAALTDAKLLLQKAHERLRKLPNSQEMCDQILHEMNKISEAMKASSRDVRRLGSRSRTQQGAVSSKSNK